jgi:hypothetical protein
MAIITASAPGGTVYNGPYGANLQQVTTVGNITNRGIILRSNEGTRKKLRVEDTYLIIESLDVNYAVISSVSIKLRDEFSDVRNLNWPKQNGTLSVKEDIQITLPAGSNSYNVPNDSIIEYFDIDEPTAINFKVGDTFGGDEYVQTVPLAAGGGLVEALRKFKVGSTIYFGGITNDTIITISKKKV